jgi:NitT/TauT family transport system permease protein
MRLIIAPLALLLAWQILASTGFIPDLFLPSPLMVAQRFGQWIQGGDFWLDVGYSTSRVMAAFGMSLVFALPAALLIERSPIARVPMQALVDFFRYVPVPALVPLTVLFFGVGETSKIVLLFVGTFFQLVILFADAYSRVPRAYHDLFYSLKYGERKIWKRMTQAVGPQLFDACRVTVGWCWTYVIIAELVAAEYGIGHAIKEAQRFSDTAGVFAGILTMTAIGFLTDMTFRVTQPRVFPYLRNEVRP